MIKPLPESSKGLGLYMANATNNRTKPTGRDGPALLLTGAHQGNYRLSETALLLQELYHTVRQLQKVGVRREIQLSVTNDPQTEEEV